jgi:hypothetical protein
MTGVDTLLSGEKARVEVPRGHSLTTPHRLDQVVVVLVKSMKNEVRELRVAERLPNSGQSVSQGLDLVEVDMRGGVKLFALMELLTKRGGTSGGVGGEAVRQRAPDVEGRGGKHHQTGDALRQGGLKRREDGMVLCDPDAVRRVLGGDLGAGGGDRGDEAR